MKHEGMGVWRGHMTYAEIKYKWQLYVYTMTSQGRVVPDVVRLVAAAAKVAGKDVDGTPVVIVNK